MEPLHGLGFAGFLAQADVVGRCVLAMLLAMSLVSWYLIVTKAIQLVSVRRRSARFLRAFWDSPSLQSVVGHLEKSPAEGPFAQLAERALAAHRHVSAPVTQNDTGRPEGAALSAEFLTRSMRRALDEETARLESGLTVLASVGSTAPFIGLFGTVWGVYHALVAIGQSGQGTLDKVAGPVGEALIMTALGLAVAVPAVLGYNAMVRANRVTLSQLDSFAHDLFALLTTGTRVGESAAPAAPAATAGLAKLAASGAA
jgi:biopolymer transport protein ExbB